MSTYQDAIEAAGPMATECWVVGSRKGLRPPAYQDAPQGWRWHGVWVPCGYSDAMAAMVWRRRLVAVGRTLVPGPDMPQTGAHLQEPPGGLQPMSLAELLRSYITRSGLPQAEIAKRANMSQAGVSNVVSGRSLSLGSLHKLIGVLEVAGAEITAEEIGQAVFVEAGVWDVRHGLIDEQTPSVALPPEPPASGGEE